MNNTRKTWWKSQGRFNSRLWFHMWIWILKKAITLILFSRPHCVRQVAAWPLSQDLYWLNQLVWSRENSCNFAERPESSRQLMVEDQWGGSWVWESLCQLSLEMCPGERSLHSQLGECATLMNGTWFFSHSAVYVWWVLFGTQSQSKQQVRPLMSPSH